MRIVRNEKQKDNLAKFCWDMAKITLGALVIAPIAQPEGVLPFPIVAGAVATTAFAVLGYLLDGRELQS